MTDMRKRIASLSPRQHEIMLGVANRLSSKEIARTLGLSPATVDSHIAVALQRLELPSRRDAALVIVQMGLVAGEYAEHGEEPIYSDTITSGERVLPSDLPHGGDMVDPPPPGSRNAFSRIYLRWKSGTYQRSAGHGAGGSPHPPSRSDGGGAGMDGPGMGEVVVRYLLDGLYISLFFSAMSAVAFLAHEVVVQCEHRHIDPVVLVILKGVSYVLAGIDGIGVITATGLLTYRFIAAIVRAK